METGRFAKQTLIGSVREISAGMDVRYARLSCSSLRPIRANVLYLYITRIYNFLGILKPHMLFLPGIQEDWMIVIIEVSKVSLTVLKLRSCTCWLEFISTVRVYFLTVDNDTIAQSYGSLVAEIRLFNDRAPKTSRYYRRF
jgi:hypothetical protein